MTYIGKMTLKNFKVKQLDLGYHQFELSQKGDSKVRLQILIRLSIILIWIEHFLKL